VRQWVEAVFGTLNGQPGLERHSVHSIQGVRVAQRLLALAAGLVQLADQHSVKRSLIAHDHSPLANQPSSVI
jgi:hypothetical protein